MAMRKATLIKIRKVIKQLAKRKASLLSNSAKRSRRIRLTNKKMKKIATNCVPQSFSLKMKVGSFYIPKENPEKPLGEDAHFYDESYNTIAVADGVGGWAKKGIDAGEYARALMENTLLALGNQAVGSVDPKQLLNEAFLNTKAQGSSTACIITLKGNSLIAANLGDSGFVVIRDGIVVYRSPVQLHRFNCPYQLGNKTRETPNLAQNLGFPLKPGDIIVAGTDGLFDNVYLAEMEDVVDACLRQQYPPELMAWNIAKLARKLSVHDYTISPSTQAAVKAKKDCLSYLGGKYDDVTVIVAYIKK